MSRTTVTTLSITDVRADLPGIVRALSEGGPAVGITVNGRMAAIISSPGAEPDTPTGWIFAGEHTRSHLPAGLRSLMAEDNRGVARLWIHIATGAFVMLVPRGNWDEHGSPGVYYISADQSHSVEIIPWSMESWSGENPTEYHGAMDRAARYVTAQLTAATG